MRDRNHIIERLKGDFRWNRRNSLTDAITPITLRRIYNNGTEHSKISIGTAFIIKCYPGDGWLLVSNYHNFSGKSVDGSSHGSFAPNFVDVEFRTRFPTPQKGWFTIGRTSLRYMLLDKDENRIYFDLTADEDFKFRGDIAVLPIAIPKRRPDAPEVELIADHQPFWDLNRGAELSVGEDCFVVGYPRGLQGDYREPIWKRASVASEPNNTYRGKLAFLIDTATREGMSGSPVIVKKVDAIGQANPQNVSDPREYLEDRLVGIYSGREGTDEMGVQLGVVWRSDLMELLIAKIGEEYVPQEPVFL